MSAFTADPLNAWGATPEVLSAHLEGEAVLLDLSSKDYFQLNATAALIWKAIERNQPTDQLIGALVETFDVSAEQAAASIREFLTELAAAGLLIRKA